MKSRDRESRAIDIQNFQLNKNELNYVSISSLHENDTSNDSWPIIIHTKYCSVHLNRVMRIYQVYIVSSQVRYNLCKNKMANIKRKWF